ncbi:hypothetical protein [Oceanirhabdus sp. W0125-5]|uniref:hypothetical protein n=1 Tax=Oceanirhabdus sp. W0125-5 TaxID=2999116 RepID=UPI0022F2FE47|nr:hypothetical protein [Oceanirhabdus sp. W0125-5]WBW96854.1 hypothetical protein OW730_24660 [Oceanirhabdus sp. W0125-5]
MRDFTEKQIDYIKDHIYNNTIFPLSILDVHDDGSFNEEHCIEKDGEIYIKQSVVNDRIHKAQEYLLNDFEDELRGENQEVCIGDLTREELVSIINETISERLDDEEEDIY